MSIEDRKTFTIFLPEVTFLLLRNGFSRTSKALLRLKSRRLCGQKPTFAI